MLQKDVSDTVLHSSCTELGLCFLQFEKRVVMYLDLIRKTKWKNYMRIIIGTPNRNKCGSKGESL